MTEPEPLSAESRSLIDWFVKAARLTRDGRHGQELQRRLALVEAAARVAAPSDGLRVAAHRVIEAWDAKHIEVVAVDGLDPMDSLRAAIDPDADDDQHDAACGRYEGHPDPLCDRCAALATTGQRETDR